LGHTLQQDRDIGCTTAPVEQRRDRAAGGQSGTQGGAGTGVVAPTHRRGDECRVVIGVERDETEMMVEAAGDARGGGRIRRCHSLRNSLPPRRWSASMRNRGQSRKSAT